MIEKALLQDPASDAPVSKVELVRQMLERRIHFGTYLAGDLPAERELAEDMQVSRMTARKALQQLLDKGTLERLPNGRLTVLRNRSAEFAVLVPSVASAQIEGVILALNRVAKEKNCVVRTRLFMHWDDPVVASTLEEFAGVFLIVSAEPIPPRVMQMLRSNERKTASLQMDLTALGLPSMDLLPPRSLHAVLDHLAAQGHRTIDCFNTQTCDATIDARLEQWNLWLSAHRMEGRLHNYPILPYESPLARAYEEMGRLLSAGALTGSALFCTTMPAAVGAARAMRDVGMTPGGTGANDIAIAAFSGENLGQYMCPSITSLKTPELDPYLAVCMNWMRQPDAGWIGSLLIQAAQPELFVGESTRVQRV